ncbi:MutS-related protein, partial [Anaerosolibacter sp.]|uniref:MutS-related protein n=1 Tax=Anaerosolibacter sp. TaxID=1872527 RepID=UPI0039EEFED5
PYFKDIGLDLIFSELNQTKKDFELDKYFYQPLHDLEIIRYRQSVMKALEDSQLRKILTEFSNEVYFIRRYMNSVRKALSTDDKWNNNFLTRGHMLDYAQRYCSAISKVRKSMLELATTSEGILGFVKYIDDYCNSEAYTLLETSINVLREEFSEIEYCMLITGGTIKVVKYENQKDYSKQILTTFEKFRQGEVKDYRHNLSEEPLADHVEAAVLDLLSRLYKGSFKRLSDFSSEFIQFDDETIIRFSQEIQFYITWLDYIQPLKDIGFSFTYPIMNPTAEKLYCYESFDLALASNVQNKTVVNDFIMKCPESIVVITGPNQGGKSTYARMIGQLHHLASVGLCIPGREASLYLFDNIYTHFGREEDLSSQNGKLKDDLERLYEIMSNATHHSLIIINEIFTSTTVNDAVMLGTHMMNQLIALKAPTIIVTFLDELAEFGESVVSMMSTVQDENPIERTFKVIRKPPDGLAYALHIASKHGLTYELLCRRLSR